MKATKRILQFLTAATLSFIFAATLGFPALGFLFLGLSAINFLPGGSLYSVCGAISAAILKDCTNPLVGGTDTTIYLANFADIASVTRNGSNPQIIEAITMVATKKFYKYEGQNGSVEPEQHLIKQKYARVYDHLIKYKVFNATPTTKAQLELQAVGRIVAIVENNWRNGTAGNGAYEIYGLEVGLEIENLDRVLADADTQGAFDITLKTPETSKEAHLPATLFITSYAATQAVVAALIA
jgi:hypothetical protein